MSESPVADVPAEVIDPVMDAPPPEFIADEAVSAAPPADRPPAPPAAAEPPPPEFDRVTLTPAATRLIDQAYAAVQQAEQAFNAAREQYRILAAVAIAQAGADPGGGWRPVREGDTLSFVRAVGPGGA